MIDPFNAVPAGRMARVAVMLAIVLAIAGCGGGDADEVDGAATTTTSPTTESPVATTTTEVDGAGAGGGDVVENAPTLAGTDWDVEMLHSAEYGLTNVWPDTEVSLSFGADGSLSGFSGCTDFTASYEVVGDYLERDPLNDVPEGQQIVITGLPDPVGGCDADADEQEVDLFNALDTAEVWQIDAEGGLTLIGPQGLHIGAVPAG